MCWEVSGQPWTQPSPHKACGGRLKVLLSDSRGYDVWLWGLVGVGDRKESVAWEAALVMFSPSPYNPRHPIFPVTSFCGCCIHRAAA